MPRTPHSNTQGQRQLRVGEEIRRVLAELLLRGEFDTQDTTLSSVTVTEVRVSPELKNATVFVMPLGGINREAIMEVLKSAAPYAQTLVSKRVQLRYMPRLHFKLDESFDEASRVEALFQHPTVRKDTGKLED